MDNEEVVTKNIFYEQMSHFEKHTADKLVQILDNEKYELDTEVLGLIALARALIYTYAPTDADVQALIKTSVYMLEKDISPLDSTLD